MSASATQGGHNYYSKLTINRLQRQRIKTSRHWCKLLATRRDVNHVCTTTHRPRVHPVTNHQYNIPAHLRAHGAKTRSTSTEKYYWPVWWSRRGNWSGMCVCADNNFWRKRPSTLTNTTLGTLVLTGWLWSSDTPTTVRKADWNLKL